MEENYNCKDCGKICSWEGCERSFGCNCEAHSHIEFHEKNDWMTLPQFKNQTFNQLEGKEMD